MSLYSYNASISCKRSDERAKASLFLVKKLTEYKCYSSNAGVVLVCPDVGAFKTVLKNWRGQRGHKNELRTKGENVLQ